MNENQKCKDCFFWLHRGIKEGERKVGECRRNPPQVIVLVEKGKQPVMNPSTGIVVDQQFERHKIQGSFPVMAEDDSGCGEYDPIVPS